MTFSLRGLANACVFTLWLAAILTCVVGAWLGIMASQDFLKVTFDTRPF
jgi:hypothetical protein